MIIYSNLVLFLTIKIFGCPLLLLLLLLLPRGHVDLTASPTVKIIKWDQKLGQKIDHIFDLTIYKMTMYPISAVLGLRVV